MNYFTMMFVLICTPFPFTASSSKESRLPLMVEMQNSSDAISYNEDKPELPLTIQQGLLDNIIVQAQADLTAAKENYVPVQDKIFKQVAIGNYCIDVLDQVSNCEQEKRSLLKYKEDQQTWQQEQRFLYCCLSNNNERQNFSREYAIESLGKVRKKLREVKQLQSTTENILSNRGTRRYSFDTRSRSNSSS